MARINTSQRRTGTFLDELAIGRYIEGTSPLHTAPTAGKALLLSLVAATTFLFQSATAFAVVGLALALLAQLAHLPKQLFWRSLRPLLLLAAFTMAAGAFINHAQASIFHPSFSWAGLHQGALYAARLLLITLMTTIFFLTTRPQEAVTLGIGLMSPLRLLGIDRKELSLLVHLAYRFLPLLTRELEEMHWGRTARNLAPPRGLTAKLQNGTDIVITVFIGALHRAETTGIAMQQRGLLESWKPSKLSKGRVVNLWPLAGTVLLAALLWRVDGRLP